MDSIDLWHELDKLTCTETDSCDLTYAPSEDALSGFESFQLLCGILDSEPEGSSLELDSDYPYNESMDSTNLTGLPITELLVQQCHDFPRTFSEFGDLCFSDAVTEQDILSIISSPASQPKVQTPPPNILAGLGSNQGNRDTVKLSKFVINDLQLMVYDNVLHQYNGIFWERLSQSDVYVLLQQEFEKHQLDDSLMPSTYKSIDWLIRSNASIQQRDFIPVQHHLLNFLDGTFNLKTMTLCPHSADDLLFNCLDLNFSDLEDTEGPVFERFIECASVGNPDVRQQVLELIAIALTGLETKSFFAAIGPSGSGKSQLGRLILDLVGKSQVMNIRGMADFGKQFSLGDIAGKRVILCMDLPDSTLPPSAVGMLKQLVGDDPICVERKYRDPVMISDKPVFFCAGNHPIKVPNMAKEEALLNRMVVIPFLGVPSEEERVPHLYSALYNERLYIIRQAIGAYCDLMANGAQPTRTDIPIQYAPKDAQNEVVVITEFIQSTCVFEQTAEVTTSELYALYCTYCAEEDEMPLSYTPFSQRLTGIICEQNGPATRIKRAAGEGRGYRGIRPRRPDELSYSV